MLTSGTSGSFQGVPGPICNFHYLLGEVGQRLPKSIEFGRIRADVSRNRAKFHGYRAELVTFEAGFGRNRTNVLEFGSDFHDFGHNSVEIAPF